ncbi:MAG: ribulose-phosphate 3-epimerase [Chloroflexi bacterium]|nr:ribulose-phosphate 3-epimerase [Chloroflexota bacterium]
MKIAPSILSADFGRIGEQVAEASAGGADAIHVDIMDGQFVPNITIGPLVVEAIRRWTDIPLDIHMMIVRPENFVNDFIKAGGNIISVHAEACTHLHRVVQQIKDAGAKASVAMNPATPISAIEEVLPELDQALVMTVNPGFGGQRFIHSMLDKIRRVRAILDERGLPADLEVDGGVNISTARLAAQAGARVLVAGSAVYNKETSVAEAIARLRKSL